MIFTRTKNGQLLFGVSNSGQLKIVSGNGENVCSFKLNISPIPVDKDYIEAYKAHKIEGLNTGNRSRKIYAKILSKLPYENAFGSHLPYYKKIAIDSEGNILVFKWTKCLRDCEIIFQVYSPEGKYICETKLDPGKFDFKIRSLFDNIYFTDEGILGLIELKNSEDVSLRIGKFRFVSWEKKKI